jgi:hypothetical protein
MFSQLKVKNNQDQHYDVDDKYYHDDSYHDDVYLENEEMSSAQIERLSEKLKHEGIEPHSDDEHRGEINPINEHDSINHEDENVSKDNSRDDIDYEEFNENENSGLNALNALNDKEDYVDSNLYLGGAMSPEDFPEMYEDDGNTLGNQSELLSKGIDKIQKNSLI